MDNFENICRICLKTETGQEFTRIFSNNEIPLKIYLISGIKLIDLTEQLGPSLICPTCLKELYQSIVFRKKCQSSDEFFKTKIAKIEAQLWNGHDFVNVKLESLDSEVNEGSDAQTYELKSQEIIEHHILREDISGEDEGCSLENVPKPPNCRRRGRIKQPEADTSTPKKNS